jgi:redox-sensitive bicupin YhaK (pirin superfamily)
MKTTIYKSADRGSADYGWLQAKYSFSFANYYNPSAIQFGALRVLNDDIVKGGMGFGKHPHDNMEIISVPLKGALKHKDSMSNEWIPLHAGEVQVMSAGKGIQHSEMNNSMTEDLNLFQIWILPNKANIEPRYDQKVFSETARKNTFQFLVSDIENPIEGTLHIHQQARISRIDLEIDKEVSYQTNSIYNGVYVMLIDGEVDIAGHALSQRDAIGIEQTADFRINAKKESQLLLVEVPMK